MVTILSKSKSIVKIQNPSPSEMAYLRKGQVIGTFHVADESAFTRISVDMDHANSLPRHMSYWAKYDSELPTDSTSVFDLQLEPSQPDYNWRPAPLLETLCNESEIDVTQKAMQTLLWQPLPTLWTDDERSNYYNSILLEDHHVQKVGSANLRCAHMGSLTRNPSLLEAQLSQVAKPIENTADILPTRSVSLTQEHDVSAQSSGLEKEWRCVSDNHEAYQLRDDRFRWGKYAVTPRTNPADGEQPSTSFAVSSVRSTSSNTDQVINPEERGTRIPIYNVNQSSSPAMTTTGSVPKIIHFGARK